MENTPQKGSFLIANPRLQDPTFSRTVVLICDYNEEGAFGLVINRALDIPILELLKENPLANGNQNRAFNGGPVHTNHLFYLHSNDNEQTNISKKICDGVYLGGNTDYLNNLLSNKSANKVSYRLYLGSAGWGAGQLDEEMKINSWIICPANEKFIFHPHPNNLWREILYSMGGQYTLLSTYPPDPILN